jgi:AcrR family transcriptional regulator
MPKHPLAPAQKFHWRIALPGGVATVYAPAMPHTRPRLQPQVMREIALAEARAVLIEEGPQAVTLAAVAKRISRTHANLLHHFGSAEGLRTAMAEMMMARITAEVREAVLLSRAIEGDARDVVDRVFDAFEKEGMAALVSWMILSRDHAALKPILDSVHDLVEQLGDHRGASVRHITLSLFLAALGDGLIGTQMADALELPRDAGREVIAAQIKHMRGW